MKNFLVHILILASLTCAGQTGVVRLEFEAAVNSDIYKLIPLGSQGFLLFFETKDYVGEDSKNWFFTFFDQHLKEVWKANIAVVSDAQYQDHIATAIPSRIAGNCQRNVKGAMQYLQ